MALKPWREIATPHNDVLHGTFKEAEFAADITQVVTGKATAEYQNAQQFYSRTFITEGMRLLLISVAQRLAGHGGDPVIQLQTSFGGGKTHTMLAVYHLATCPDTSALDGIPSILDASGIQSLPQARIAVLDGIKLSPSQPSNINGIKVNTLWGELACQLLGQQGYDMVANADRDGTSPGKEVVADILRKASPVVILIDELVAYIRQFESGKEYAGGTFDSNMTFIQALTEAVKVVPDAILLASLPESDLEIGGESGQRTLAALEKYFGRVESVWKPVAAEEAFEIVRRRLFSTTGAVSEIEQICKAYADFYHSNSDKFPTETQESIYIDRLRRSYPIHPEIFDRLYEDWSTLDKFQRTRGVLQYMAIVIHHLWQSNNQDTLILPGSIPLEDPVVRNKSIHYLPQGWEPVIEREVDGPRSATGDIDKQNPLFGSVQAARRTMRTVFLGSAPSNAKQMVRGLKKERILLGAVQPGQQVHVFEDVQKRLRDRLHYLYSEDDRFWLDTKPNLRREMESRKQNVNEKEQVLPLLKDRVQRTFGQSHSFAGIHVFAPSADIPDEIGSGPRLVVLPLDAAFSKATTNPAYTVAEEILRNRGNQPRQRQNRLIFLAPDNDVLSRLKDQARTYIAWESIVSDVENEKLNMDLFQAKQAKKQLEGAMKTLQQLIRETYKWLFCPLEEFVQSKPKLVWESTSVSPAAQNLVKEIEQKLRDEEWVIYEWAPVHLKNLLEKWYFKDGKTAQNEFELWFDMCQYLYMPRLKGPDVLSAAINEGLKSEDYFGRASGLEGDKYLGFSFGTGSIFGIDKEAFLIEKHAAAEYKARTISQQTSQASTGNTGQQNSVGTGTSSTTQPPIGGAGGVNPALKEAETKKQFYGTINLDPVTAKMDFANIVDEVIQQFTSQLGVNVDISVEISAHKGAGFDEALQRAVRENCNVLKFKNAEFEGGE